MAFQKLLISVVLRVARMSSKTSRTIPLLCSYSIRGGMGDLLCRKRCGLTGLLKPVSHVRCEKCKLGRIRYPSVPPLHSHTQFAASSLTSLPFEHRISTPHKHTTPVKLSSYNLQSIRNRHSSPSSQSRALFVFFAPFSPVEFFVSFVSFCSNSV